MCSFLFYFIFLPGSQLPQPLGQPARAAHAVRAAGRAGEGSSSAGRAAFLRRAAVPCTADPNATAHPPPPLRRRLRELLQPSGHHRPCPKRIYQSPALLQRQAGWWVSLCLLHPRGLGLRTEPRESAPRAAGPKRGWPGGRREGGAGGEAALPGGRSRTLGVNLQQPSQRPASPWRRARGAVCPARPGPSPCGPRGGGRCSCWAFVSSRCAFLLLEDSLDRGARARDGLFAGVCGAVLAVSANHTWQSDAQWWWVLRRVAGHCQSLRAW